MQTGTKIPLLATVAALLMFRDQSGHANHARPACGVLMPPDHPLPRTRNRPPVGWRQVQSRRRYRAIAYRQRRNAHTKP